VEGIGTELSLSNEDQYASAIATARSRLGEKSFDAALADRTISLEAAIREALDTDEV
jgi:hypothetical protein